MSETVSIEPITARNLPEIQADLVELLRETVNGGDTVGFLPPLSTDEAAAYWREVREALEGGGRRMVVARRAGRVVGTVQLDLAMQTNGRHRAEVVKLLVHRGARRQGLGRRLMGAVEGVARDEGRTLLVLDTRQGEPSEAFYAALGYRRAGVIPNYARSADGTLHATVLFYKERYAVDEARLLEEISRPLDRGEDRVRKAAAVAGAFRRVGGYRWVGLYEVAEREIANLAFDGPCAPAYPHFPVIQGLSGSAVASGRTVVANDVREDPRYLTAFGSTRSEIVVPVLDRAARKVVGTIDVESESVGAFSEGDRAALEHCARAVAALFEQEVPRAGGTRKTG